MPGRSLIAACALLWGCSSSAAGTGGGVSAKPASEEGGPDPCVEAGTCPPGVWINVTPGGIPAADLGDGGGFGPGSIVVDPVRPSDLYVAPIDGVWKSSDYGNSWTHINTTLAYAPIGLPMAVAGTMPAATLWIDSGDGH